MAFDYAVFNWQKHGGISRYYAGLAELLPDHGVRARILAPLYISDRLRDLPAGVVWGRHVEPSHRQQRVGAQLGERLHKPLVYLTGARIVHETTFHAHRLAPARCAVVLTVYDLIAELNPDLPECAEQIFHRKGAVARADVIVCISESTRRDLIRFYPEAADKAIVILLGFDAGFEAPDARGPLHDRPYIVYVGMRRDYKNWTGLIEAFGASRRLRAGFDLVCVGDGPFKPTEVALIEREGLTGKVHQRDADDRDLRSWYGHAALFVYPSLYEGFGIPPLEAMAAGCPVVAMDVSSVPEVCGDAAEYGDPQRPETLGPAMENVVFSNARTAELRAAGTRRLARFSWDECARQHSVVYKGLR